MHRSCCQHPEWEPHPPCTPTPPQGIQPARPQAAQDPWKELTAGEQPDFYQSVVSPHSHWKKSKARTVERRARRWEGQADHIARTGRVLGFKTAAGSISPLQTLLHLPPLYAVPLQAASANGIRARGHPFHLQEWGHGHLALFPLLKVHAVKVSFISSSRGLSSPSSHKAGNCCHFRDAWATPRELPAFGEHSLIKAQSDYLSIEGIFHFQWGDGPLKFLGCPGLQSPGLTTS